MTFFTLFFIPTLMIVFGVVLTFFTPKKNNWFGYRSSSSLINEETWNYANKTCGFFLFFSGGILLVVSDIIFFTCKSLDQFTTFQIIKLIADLIVLIVSIPYTEIKLKKKFK